MFFRNLLKKQIIYLCVEVNILEHQIIHGFIIRPFQDYKLACLFLKKIIKIVLLGDM